MCVLNRSTGIAKNKICSKVIHKVFQIYVEIFFSIESKALLQIMKVWPQWKFLHTEETDGFLEENTPSYISTFNTKRPPMLLRFTWNESQVRDVLRYCFLILLGSELFKKYRLKLHDVSCLIPY